MNLIVAVDKNWGIGKKNRLLVSIPADMKYFREKTTGKVVVMGRKTLESFPGQRPLPKRENIVLTRDNGYKKEGAVIVHSKEELITILKSYKQEDIFVIGGESIYRELLDLCHKAYVTKIEKKYDADTYFPDLDQKKEWKVVHESEGETYLDLQYRFLIYEKKDDLQ